VKWQNFVIIGPIFFFFTVKFRKDLRRKMVLKLPPPQICCYTTLWKANGQLYSFTEQLIHFTVMKQEAQLMLKNPRDAFRGQSRSQTMVPFDMLGMVSY